MTAQDWHELFTTLFVTLEAFNEEIRQLRYQVKSSLADVDYEIQDLNNTNIEMLKLLQEKLK